MDENSKNRRRKYFIRKSFQSRFIIKFCILVMIGAFLSGIIIYMMSKNTVTTTFENSRLLMKSTADFILPAVLLASAIVIVFIGALAIALTLFTSHNIVGPLYRMEKDIEDVASGDLTKKFKVRKTDEIKTLATSLEKMTNVLNRDIADIKNSLFEIETALEEPDKKSALKGLKEKIKDLRNLLTKFTT